MVLFIALNNVTDVLLVWDGSVYAVWLACNRLQTRPPGR